MSIHYVPFARRPFKFYHKITYAGTTYLYLGPFLFMYPHDAS